MGRLSQPALGEVEQWPRPGDLDDDPWDSLDPHVGLRLRGDRLRFVGSSGGPLSKPITKPRLQRLPQVAGSSPRSCVLTAFDARDHRGCRAHSLRKLLLREPEFAATEDDETGDRLEGLPAAPEQHGLPCRVIRSTATPSFRHGRPRSGLRRSARLTRRSLPTDKFFKVHRARCPSRFLASFFVHPLLKVIPADFGNTDIRLRSARVLPKHMEERDNLNAVEDTIDSTP